MALLDAGWFQTTWFPSQWWQDQWWLEYGTAVAGGDSAHYYYMRKPQPKDKKPLLIQVKNLLKALKGE